MSWRTWLRLGRVSNLPTVWTNVVAGAVLAGAAPSTPGMVVMAAGMSSLYVGGMFLNDAFDRASDARERPERPIPSGLVSAPAVFAAGFALLALGLVLVATHPRWWPNGTLWPPVASGALLAAAIVVYDAWHKRNPLAPVLMALCRVLVYATVALAAAGALPAPLMAGTACVFCYLIGLTYAARQETQRVYRNAWPLLLIAVPFVWTAGLLAAADAGAVLYLATLAWVGAAVLLLVARTPPEIPRAVGMLIAGIALVDALLLARAGAIAAALGAVAAFALTRAAHRWVPGT